MKKISKEFCKVDALTLAPQLLGKIVRLGECSGRIVETEAYMEDKASHARSATPRSRVMRETYGCWYVYFTYGMHHCVNVTAGTTPGGVLIRALEPLTGIETMQKRRGKGKGLASGPAKLTQALGITTQLNGSSLHDPLELLDDGVVVDAKDVVETTRIGIKQDVELPWRFYIRGNESVSVK